MTLWTEWDEPLKLVEDQEFDDDVLVLDYHFYRNCSIRNCTIIYGGSPCRLLNNTIMNNTVEYCGPAAWTLDVRQLLTGGQSGVDDRGNISLP